MSARTERRPLRSFSTQEKLEAVRRVHLGESKASIARDIGVAVSTFWGWCKNEEKLFNREQSSEDRTETSKLDVSNTLHCRNSRTLTNSRVVHFKKYAQPYQVFGNEKNRAKVRRLGLEFGLRVPKTFPSDDNRAKILEILRSNLGIAENVKFLMHQYHQNISLIKNMQAMYMVSSPTGSSSEEHINLPRTTQTSDQKVWNWLSNHHQDGYGAYEDEICQCEI